MNIQKTPKQEISLGAIVTIFVTWVVVIHIFGLIALNRLNLNVDSNPWVNNPSYSQQKSWNPFALAGRWDAYFYQDITENGYRFDAQTHQGNIAFFPLYPLAMKTLGVFTGNALVAGWAVSLASLFGALLVLALLVRDFHPDIRNPHEALIFLLIFPTAMFFASIYSESLFLFLALVSVYAARHQKWWWAAVFGAFAAFTRFAGIMLFVFLVIEYYLANRKKLWRPEILSLLFVPIATCAVFLYHKIVFGNFFAWFEVQKNWGRNFTPHFTLWGAEYASQTAAVLNIGFVLFGITASYLIMQRLRTSYGIYMLATLALPLMSGTTLSMERFLLVLFPIPIFIASVQNPLIKQIYALISILLLALYTTLYVNGYWAG